jgi:hypothetical protein
MTSASGRNLSMAVVALTLAAGAEAAPARYLHDRWTGARPAGGS